MVRALGWEDYPCVAGGLFILVSADGDYFRDGTEPFIAILLGFWAIIFWPHMQKRVKKPELLTSDFRFSIPDEYSLHTFVQALRVWLGEAKFLYIPQQIVSHAYPTLGA